MVRLLCVEHVEKNDKPMLYLVFEYMDTDLKKYIDLHGRGATGKPLAPKVVQVRWGGN
jgi:cyclin-dependent kinase